MGHGSYNYDSAKTRGVTYASQTREEVFKQTNLNTLMNPKGITFREARDSEEHPNSFPIIIALDETGSMSRVPEYIIKYALPDVIGKIIENRVADPQVMFMGIGDCCFNEEAPLQVGQFESSDELMEKWLKFIYLEGRGGGNDSESYPLAWYFAQHHIVTDSWEKRQKKGVLITIGDEPCQDTLFKEHIKKYIGDNLEKDIKATDLLKQVREKWQVFHIHCDDGYYRSSKKFNWPKLLGPNLIKAGRTGQDIGDIIVKIVVSCYND